jgi:hypothetical protein
MAEGVFVSVISTSQPHTRQLPLRRGAGVNDPIFPWRKPFGLSHTNFSAFTPLVGKVAFRPAGEMTDEGASDKRALPDSATAEKIG